MADTVAQVVPAPFSPPPLPGERYGRYQLLERIGKGGMAEIFRAITGGIEGFSRLFVIKRIRPEKSQSREFIRMFCEEARLCAMLHHPNIVQVYDFGQIDGSYFLAMEYLHGKDLSTVMRALRAARGAVPPAVAAFVAQQAALGLHHAHALVDGSGQPVHIVHRDVTPSNIMLLRTGAVKILDFGIAKDVRQGESEVIETDAGQVKGKLAYLAPEQVRNVPLDGRADVFSLGVVLWEMLTGQRLFTSESEFQTMRNVLILPIPAPSTVRPEIPVALDAIVGRALERDRDKRYPTAAAMAAELEQVVHHERFVGQAVPQLLEQLFGEDPSGLTPSPGPGALLAGIGLENAVSGRPALVEVPRTRSSSSGGGRSSSSVRQIPLGLGPPDAAAEVSLEIVGAATPSPADPVAAATRFVSAHRRATIVSGVALIAGLIVAFGRPSSPVVVVVDRPVAAAPPAPVADPVTASLPVAAVTPLLAPASAALLAVGAPAHHRPPAKLVARAGAPRAKPAPRRSSHEIATDLTLNPFR
ncbi:MAG TPA: serine/threonine-protein kinase [Polyangia bacterium]